MLVWNVRKTTLSTDLGRGCAGAITARKVGFLGADDRMR
jgi:hypothetical protein